MKKIFFINPPSPNRTPIIRDVYRCGRTSKEGMIWCQTQLAELAATMAHLGELRIIDCIAENISYKKLRKIFLKEHPSHVIFEVIPATYANDMEVKDLADEIGAVSTPVGAHTMSSKPFEPVDLNTMPTPLYHLLPLRKYTMPFLGKYTLVTTSHGCPFNCIFCRERVAFKGKFTARPIDKIIEDVRVLKHYKIQTYLFHAGNFTTDKKWVMEFCEKIGREKISWTCNTHLKTIDREMAQAMKESGCRMIAPGIESGDQSILGTARKEITIDMIWNKITMLHETGLEVWGYFTFGLPKETKKTIEKTIKLACELPLDIAHFGIATPYYGTEFYKMAKENGWLRTQQWESFDQNQSINIEYPGLKAEDIKQGIREAYKRFYLRPKQIKRIIKEGLNTDISTLIRIIRGWL